jgi:hypothetical protein
MIDNKDTIKKKKKKKKKDIPRGENAFGTKEECQTLF